MNSPFSSFFSDYQGRRLQPTHLGHPPPGLLPLGFLHWTIPSSSFLCQPNAEATPLQTDPSKVLCLSSGQQDDFIPSHLILWGGIIMLILQKRKLGIQEAEKLAQVHQLRKILTQGKPTRRSKTTCNFSPPPKRGRNMLRLKAINRAFPLSLAVPGHHLLLFPPHWSLGFQRQCTCSRLRREVFGWAAPAKWVFVTLFPNRDPQCPSPCWMSCLNRSAYSVASTWSHLLANLGFIHLFEFSLYSAVFAQSKAESKREKTSSCIFLEFRCNLHFPFRPGVGTTTLQGPPDFLWFHLLTCLS